MLWNVPTYTSEVKTDRRGIEVSNADSAQRTVINNTDCPQNYTLSGNYVRDLLSEKTFEGTQNATVVEIPPFSAMILEKIN